MKGFVDDIEKLTEENEDFRRVLYTGHHLQLVLMSLQPGEEQTVRFAVPVRDLGFHGLDMRYTVEPGAFKVWDGPNAVEGLEGDFEVQGD